MEGSGVFQRLWILPCISFGFFPLSFLVSYGIAVLNGNLSPYFPAISETGTGNGLENHVFATLVNLGSFVLLSVYVIRYYVIREWLILQGRESFWIRAAYWLNILSVPFFIASSFGTMMIANIIDGFGHIIACCVCFISGIIYGYISVVISVITRIVKWNAAIQFVLILFGSVGILYFQFSIPWISKINKLPYNHTDGLEMGRINKLGRRRTIDTTDELFYPFIMQKVAEWLAAFCYGIFVLSFALEFRKFSCKLPRLYLKTSAKTESIDSVDQKSSFASIQTRNSAKCSNATLATQLSSVEFKAKEREEPTVQFD